jgi:MIP family channel proteins
MGRRYAAEFLGAFAIVFFGCGSMITLHGQPGAHLMVNVVFGLAVCASVYALAHISSAHFNPAVSVGFAVANRFPWRFVAPYILAQLFGAVTGSALHATILPAQSQAANFGATLPKVDIVRCLLVEAILTFFLMFVVMSVATDRRVHGAIPGLVIGMVVTFCGLFGGPITGCSMNPARSFGPALFAGGPALAVYWVYIIGPVIGAALAARAYEAIRGNDEHVEEPPNDLEEALEKIESRAS